MVKRVKFFLVYWTPVFFWMGLIFWLSSFHKLQASPVSWQDFVIRKVIHFTEYCILFVFCYRAIKNSRELPKLKTVLLALLMTVIYAASDEYHQTFVSGRSGRFFDIGVDSAGGLFGAILIVKLKPFLPQRLVGFLENIKAI